MAVALAASPVQEELLQPERQLRSQLAAAARTINWSYAIFWSISSTQPGILTWTDGFYNGEVKTRKIANSAELTADQLVMQRSEQLRELYEALLSGECDRRAARPVASLSPEDLGDTEWYYVVCMTYAFRPGQGLPGRSFASNEHVWLCNAHLADSKAFPRALLAKTIVCIPLISGVLELGTTDPVVEDPDLVSQATASFWELPFPACSEEPGSSPSANETGKASDIIVFEDLDHNAMETMIAGAQELGEAESLSNASLEHVTKEINEFYSLCEEIDVQPLEDSWIMDGSFEVPSSPQPAPVAAAANDAATASTPVGRSRATSFTAWTRSESDSDEAAVPVIEEPQKLLKKVVAGGAWAGNNGGGGTARTSQESGIIKNHVMSERKRREKLNEMFLALKSLVPSIHKVDKASILAETIAYVKELQRRVQELESSREPIISRPSGETTRLTRRHDDEVIKVSAGSKRKGSELGGDVERQRPWTLSKDGASNVTVTVSDKDVLLEVQCRWEELLLTRVFDAIKSLHLDVLSVQASAPEGFMGLKIQAQFASSAAVVPWMISEALRKAIGKR
ncbi:Anthocyanin regulatory Lc protein [Dichanthelium oligosanthes]|uniref:Anthocyanin regulatory Lc protein n=1 Tax=Dichanthelium oligosanthes TaxID=888268 RepID=A0A1E5VA45_9POAL|nr:Anthocyanin regulatory Lc protein [Dichanthelium oligosanthes]